MGDKYLSVAAFLGQMCDRAGRMGLDAKVRGLCVGVEICHEWMVLHWDSFSQCCSSIIIYSHTSIIICVIKNEAILMLASGNRAEKDIADQLLTSDIDPLRSSCW